MTPSTTSHTHISTRNTSGQVCRFKRDTIGWVWASTYRRVSTRFLCRLVAILSSKPGASVVYHTPNAQVLR